MTHPDPRIAEIQARNAQAIADATGAPPPEIADDPAAYLEWSQQDPARRPTVPHGPYRPLTAAPSTNRRDKYSRPVPPAVTPSPDLEAERRRQLDALEALIDTQEQQP